MTDRKDDVADMDNVSVSAQPMPTGAGTVILEFVLRDLKDRAAGGLLKYGTLLRAHNGRDALVDAYQEALDLAMYLRQAIAEREGSCEGCAKGWKRYSDQGIAYHVYGGEDPRCPAVPAGCSTCQGTAECCGGDVGGLKCPKPGERCTVCPSCGGQAELAERSKT